MAVEVSDGFGSRLRAAQLEVSSASAADARGATDVPVIYHYTDPKGLIGILSDSRLWATDVSFLNDSSELRYAAELQQEILEEIVNESPDGSLQRNLAVKALEDRSFLGGKTYVVCFCAKDDLLTQWKAYGSSGSGFSIGFDRGKLQSMLAELAPTDHSDALWMGMIEVALAQVRYSRGDQERALRRAFDRYVALLSVGSPEFEIKKCADAIANNASASASRFKHPAFASEKEWRIVISTSAFSNPELFFRSSSRTVIQYTKTGIKEVSKLPVVSITIGPTLEQELSKRSVLDLLAATDYLDIGEKAVDIRASKIPLTLTD